MLKRVQHDSFLRLVIARGFTLIELLVAIMIIGILAAVAVPQYQKAVMKSRFAAMMPIAKTLANANEVYYAEHDEYSTDPAKLNVTPQAGTPDGTAINMYSNPEEVSFVRVENPGVPNARYVVYQKLSENFPETTWCEAGDTRTEELCVALGGTLPEGLTGNSSGDNTNYKAYLLTGQYHSGDTFAETGTGTPADPATPACPENSVCDEEGNVTSCSTGYVLNGTTCEQEPECEGEQPQASQACAIGSGTMTRTLTCANNTWSAGGWNTSGCSVTAAEAQAFANEHCTFTASKGTGCVGIVNKDGTVSVCENYTGSINSAGECVYNHDSHQVGAFEIVYNPDGTRKSTMSCVSGAGTSGVSLRCEGTGLNTYNPDGSILSQTRYCANGYGANKDLTCPNNAYAVNGGSDVYYDTQQHAIANNYCSAVASNGKCTAYSKMYAYDNIYTNGKYMGQVVKNCMSISGTTCNNYKPTYAYTSVEGSSNKRWIECYNANGSSSSTVNADGSCPSGYTWQQKDPDGTRTPCSGGDQPTGIDWKTVTCS